ncbi:MAG: cytochrome c oxidase subunit 4 [Acidimicrobiaceae bacterium]|nr:cytochrome c oxidase subunit 4 [Acidimicrobiaceae bacterium]
MKSERSIYMLIGVFFFAIMVVYFLWSGEAGGSIMLFAAAGLGIMPGLYFSWWAHRMPPRPEDRVDATMADGSGPVGAFPANTIWPFVFGMGAALTALSLAFGAWLAVVGLAFIISTALNVSLESRRGGSV